MKQCEKCGLAIDDNAAFCTNCGAAIGSGAANPVVPGIDQSMGVEMPVMNNATTEANGMPTATNDMAAAPNGLTMNQPVSSSPVVPPVAPSEEPKKKMDSKMIALIAISAVCLIIGIVGIVLAISSNNSGKDGNGSQVAVNDTDSGTTVDVVSSGTKVSYAGYEFMIPDEYDYEITEINGDEALMASNSEEYAAVTFYHNNMTFTQIENNMEAIADGLEDEDVPSVTTSIENVDGVKFLCFDLGTFEGINIMYAISEADLYYFRTAIATNPGVSGKQYLSNVAKIVSSAKKKKSMNKTLNGNGLENLKLKKITTQSE